MRYLIVGSRVHRVASGRFRRAEISARLRRVVVEQHSLERLVDGIVDHLDQLRRPPDDRR